MDRRAWDRYWSSDPDAGRESRRRGDTVALRLKGDWVGRRVRTRIELRNGNVRIPAGTVMTVEGNRSGLRLETSPCPHCGVSVYIRSVWEGDVELLPVDESAPAGVEAQARREG
jgi:hypothetical protein